MYHISPAFRLRRPYFAAYSETYSTSPSFPPEERHLDHISSPSCTGSPRPASIATNPLRHLWDPFFASPDGSRERATLAVPGRKLEEAGALGAYAVFWPPQLDSQSLLGMSLMPASRQISAATSAAARFAEACGWLGNPRYGSLQANVLPG